MFFCCQAQPDSQGSIHTEIGVYTISKTAKGKDMIRFSIDVWDKMQQGTRFTAANLNKMQVIRFCMEISSKEKYNCMSGIGFNCSVFDCPVKPCPITVNDSNRFCSVMLKKTDANTVQLIFLDHVDWESLDAKF